LARRDEAIADYQANRDEILKKRAAYYATRKPIEARNRAVFKANNPDYFRDYRLTHRAERAAYAVQWDREHPEARRFKDQLRRSRKKHAAGRDYITLGLLESRWNYYGRRCYLCGELASATDHVIPLAKGGSQWPANLRPICNTCNNIKNATWPYDFNAHKARVQAQIATWCDTLGLVNDA
jgi:5-methylcytosine-specific restriction endonuclease McrA